MLKSIFANAGLLLSGKGAAGVMSIVYLAIAARTLGPADFGALILIHSYAMAAAGILGVRTWPAIIHFGSSMLSNNDRLGLHRLLSFTAVIDVLSGIAAAVIALIAVPWISGWLNLPENIHHMTALYCISIPFVKQVTPLGLLRMLDHFRPLALQLTVMPLVRLIGAIICLVLSLDLKAFVTIWFVSGLMHGISIWALGFWALRKEGLHTDFRFEQSGLLKGDLGWWPFVLKTSASFSAGIARQQFTVLLVGAGLGVSAAGFYRLGSDIANFISKPALLLTQSVYPTLARLAADRHIKLLRTAAFKGGAIAGTAAIAPVLLIVFFGAEIIEIIVGSDFRAAATITTLITIAGTIELYGFAVEPALLSLGRAGAILLSKIATIVVHLGLLAWLMPMLGLNGAGIALISGTVFSIGLMAWLISTNWVLGGLVGEEQKNGTSDL